ncbi:MAG TPA: carbohydrate ABC transporter permease [Chloroflexota bacterium]
MKGLARVTSGPDALAPEDMISVPAPRVDAQALVGNLLLLGIGVLFMLPLLWLIFSSIDANASWGIEMPQITAKNFSDVTTSDNVTSLYNSFYLAAIATIVATAVATLAGYALSRRRIPLKKSLMLIVLFLTGIPVSIMIVPVYQMYVTLNWLSLFPTAVFLGVTGLPFEIWLIKNFIDSVPIELEEAARMERAGTLQILRTLILPLALPGIAAAAIYGFINAWGSFLIPLILLSSPGDQPGPVTIYSFIGAAVVRYGDIAAFSVLYSVPVIVLFLIMSRLIGGGFLLGGAIKG